MRLGVQIAKSGGEPPDIITSTEGEAMAAEGITEVSQEQGKSLAAFCAEWQARIDEFLIKFDQETKVYGNYHNILSKMQQSLNVGTDNQIGARSDEIVLSAVSYQREVKANLQFATVLAEGHALLLELRQAITGQTLNTKFIISVEGKTYIVDETTLAGAQALSVSLSNFGGTSVSNPMSVAYTIEGNIQQTLESLKEQGLAEEITENDVWKRLYSLKAPYLAKKSKQTGKKYKNIFYDSKDAEIQMLYSGNPPGGGLDIKGLTVARYGQLRASLGGGGGYASPFFKAGDVGSTQVKYFKIKKNSKEVSVNFGRFSLIRDRTRELAQIFKLGDPTAIGQALLAFYTEKKSNLSNQITISMNAAAKKAIKGFFGF